MVEEWKVWVVDHFICKKCNLLNSEIRTQIAFMKISRWSIFWKCPPIIFGPCFRRYKTIKTKVARKIANLCSHCLQPLLGLKLWVCTLIFLSFTSRLLKIRLFGAILNQTPNMKILNFYSLFWHSILDIKPNILFS